MGSSRARQRNRPRAPAGSGSTRLHLVLYSLLLVATPFVLLRAFMQDAIGRLSRTAIHLGGFSVPVVLIIAGAVIAFALLWFRSAIANGRLGKPEVGLRLLREALESNPLMRGVILYNLAELYRQKDDWRRAIASYQEAVAADGPADLCHARLSECYLALGERENARDAL